MSGTQPRPQAPQHAQHAQRVQPSQRVQHGQPPQHVQHGQPPQRVQHGQPPQHVQHGQPPQHVQHGQPPQRVQHGQPPQHVQHMQNMEMQPQVQTQPSQPHPHQLAQQPAHNQPHQIPEQVPGANIDRYAVRFSPSLPVQSAQNLPAALYEPTESNSDEMEDSHMQTPPESLDGHSQPCRRVEPLPASGAPSNGPQPNPRSVPSPVEPTQQLHAPKTLPHAGALTPATTHYADALSHTSTLTPSLTPTHAAVPDQASPRGRPHVPSPVQAQTQVSVPPRPDPAWFQNQPAKPQYPDSHDEYIRTGLASNPLPPNMYHQRSHPPSSQLSAEAGCAASPGVTILGNSPAPAPISQNVQNVTCKTNAMATVPPTFPGTPPANSRIVFAGNPGAGKSTILNSLIGDVRFESGISLGGGLTRNTAMQQVGGSEYTDTPGLDDIECRKASSEQIGLALSDAAALKLVFVVTLESGRVRPADLVTMGLVMKALQDRDIDMRRNYCLIINKLEPEALSVLDGSAVRNELVNSFRKVCDVADKDVLFLALEENALGMTNCLLHSADRVAALLAQAPSVSTSTKQIVVEYVNFEQDYAKKEQEVIEAEKLVLEVIKQNKKGGGHVNPKKLVGQANSQHWYESVQGGKRLGGQMSQGPTTATPTASHGEEHHSKPLRPTIVQRFKQQFGQKKGNRVGTRNDMAPR